MIPAPPPYPGELVSSWLVRCCLWFHLPFKRFAREVLSSPALRLTFVNLWPLRPLEGLFNLSAEELLWNNTPFPYATAYLDGESYELAQQAALDGGPGMPRLLAAMQNVSGELALRCFCPRCLEDSLARHGESYWDRSHNLPGVAVCARHRCTLVNTTLPAKSTLRTIYDLPAACASVPAGSSLEPSKALIALARASEGMLTRPAGPGRSRACEWYRELAVSQGWLSRHREVSLSALQRALLKAYTPGALTAFGLQPHDLRWAGLFFRRAAWFNASPLKHLLVEVMLTTRQSPDALLDHVPPGPGGTPSEDADAFYTPMAQLELQRALANGEVLSTEQFLRRVGAYGAYRHRASELPSLRRVVLAFRGSPACRKPLQPGKTLFRKDPGLRVPHQAQLMSAQGSAL